MRKLIHHITNRIAGVILLLGTTLASAMGQTPGVKPVQKFEISQCETLTLSVVDMPGDRYTWDIYSDPNVNFATEKGDLEPAAYFENSMYEGSTVSINSIDPGRYFIRLMVWDEVECTNNLLVYELIVHESKPEVQIIGGEICQDEQVEVKIIFTGVGPWNLRYTYGDGVDILTLEGTVEEDFYVVPLPSFESGDIEMWVMEVTDQCTVNSYTVEPPPKGIIKIHPKPTNTKIYPVED